MSITCDGEGAQLTLSATDDGAILLDGKQVASLGDLQKISIVTTGGDDHLTIDESLRKFTAADDETPIAFDINMGDGNDELKWFGSPGHEGFKLTADSIDVPGGSEFENKAIGVESLNFDLGGGDDTFDGGSWPFKIELNGGPGKDNLIGGLGPDVFTLSPDGDSIDGGKGVDLVKLATDDSLVKIGAETIELAGSGNVVGYKQIEALDYQGGDGPNAVDVEAGVKFSKLFLDGGGGGDNLKVATDDALVKISDEAVSLNFSKIEIAYKEFSDFGLVADKTTPLALEIDGFKFANMDVAGGAVGSSIKLTSGLPAVQVGADQIKLSDVGGVSAGQIKYAGFDTFNYLGDGSVNKVDVEAGVKFSKLFFDGGGGGDNLKVATDDALVKISDEAVSLNFSKIEIAYKEFTDFGLVADRRRRWRSRSTASSSPTWTLRAARWGARSSSPLVCRRCRSAPIRSSFPMLAACRRVRSSTPGSTRSTISVTAASTRSMSRPGSSSRSCSSMVVGVATT